MKEFATKKIESLKKTWIWNGTIDAISLTFMNQCTALGSKLQYMALSKTNDLASKIGTFFLASYDYCLPYPGIPNQLLRKVDLV